MTPEELESAFVATAADHRRCFWLDGAGGRDWSGRRSVLGWLAEEDVSLTYDAARREVTRHAGGDAVVVGDDIFTVLGEELAAAKARGDGDERWYGYLGYAARPDLPAASDPAASDPAVSDPPLPDAVWMRPGRRAGQVRLVEHPAPPPPPPPRVGRVSHTGPRSGAGHTTPPPAYVAAYDAVQERLHAGDSYEVNLTYREAVAAPASPVEAYRRLRALDPAPYAGFLQHDVAAAPAWLLSASPERYARVTRDHGSDSGPDPARTIETRPIKGTTPRDDDPVQDDAQRAHLAADPRYRAENLMILDLLRHDLAGVCEVGTVEVPELMQVESYAAVHQLVSTVRGRLRPEVSTIEALRALFPAGSMTGAPKLRTMAVIAQVEDSARGAYAGAFGWIGADGSADLGVVIRSLMTRGDGTYRYGTGGGVTVRSELTSEWSETRWKAARLRAALD